MPPANIRALSLRSKARTYLSPPRARRREAFPLRSGSRRGRPKLHHVRRPAGRAVARDIAPVPARKRKLSGVRGSVQENDVVRQPAGASRINDRPKAVYRSDHMSLRSNPSSAGPFPPRSSRHQPIVHRRSCLALPPRRMRRSTKPPPRRRPTSSSPGRASSAPTSTAPSPITVVGEDTIKLSGNVTLERTLNQFPQLGQGNTGSVNNGGGAGVLTANLRGLGSTRTLTLVNGRRFIPANSARRRRPREHPRHACPACRHHHGRRLRGLWLGRDREVRSTSCSRMISTASKATAQYSVSTSSAMAPRRNTT